MSRKPAAKASRNIDLDQHDGLVLEQRTRVDRSRSERQKLLGEWCSCAVSMLTKWLSSRPASQDQRARETAWESQTQLSEWSEILFMSYSLYQAHSD